MFMCVFFNHNLNTFSSYSNMEHEVVMSDTDGLALQCLTSPDICKLSLYAACICSVLDDKRE